MRDTTLMLPVELHEMYGQLADANIRNHQKTVKSNEKTTPI